MDTLSIDGKRIEARTYRETIEISVVFSFPTKAPSPLFTDFRGG
jgi:hypothetical protein